MPEETAPAETAEQPYTFPFTVPDLTTASDADLAALQSSIREHAASITGLPREEQPADALQALRACRDLAVEVANERTARADRAAELSGYADEIAALSAEADTESEVAPEPEADPEPEPEPAAADPVPATASTTRQAPSVRRVAQRTGQRPAVPTAERQTFASMTAAADVPGFASGAQLTSFADVGRALSARLDQYPALTTQRAKGVKGKRPVTVYDPDDPGRRLTLKTFSRHGGVQIRREFPDELRVRDGSTNGYAVAEYAANERRLPGGNLIESVKQNLRAGRALTAAAGWCAPSDTIYDLMEMESLDGILDLPELQTTRGGWQIPIDGGPNFASIYDSLGDEGETHLTEDDVIGGAQKVCTEIPCPDFDDVRLGVDYYCLTGGLLQRRGYPEAVARFARGAAIALAHKINAGVISAIVAASSPNTVIQADPNGDDAATALLSAVELAIIDMKYRNRMSFGATAEVVLPMWVLHPIRSGLARAAGIRSMQVTDAMIVDWFATRKGVVRFVYDWQDAFVGQSGGPGGATPLSELPPVARMLVYPAGTWVKAVQDVISLDTIYDSTMLETNSYTAVFAEDGWATLQMTPESRLYTVPVDPSGVTGCCDEVPAS